MNAYPVPQPMTLDDDAIRDLVYATIDADPTILPDVDVDIDVNAGVVSIKGRVPGKRTKHAIGDAAWWIPSVVDVNNQLEVSARRERRAAKQGMTRGAA
jgi:osmotically-inducible protein OsmY